MPNVVRLPRPARVGRPALLVAAMVAGLIGAVPPAAAASITVTTFADDLGGGTDSTCSLREAIQSANGDTAFGGCPTGSLADTIVLATGTYVLTREGDEEANVSGDLDVTSPITIQGAGAALTVIDGAWASNTDRILDVRPMGDLTISGVTIQEGSTDFGAGIQANALVTLTDVVLRANTATNTGGGLWVNAGTATLNDVTVSGNSAPAGGGISVTKTATLVSITNATISGNQATGLGGGLLTSGTAEATNLTITQNRADTDGSGDGDGGGLAVISTGSVTMRNSIVGGNTDGSSPSAPDCSGTITSLGSNLVQRQTGCEGWDADGDVTGLDPKLGPLADNGGPTPTHALLTGSYAIHTWNACGSMDQRGLPRPQGSGCDRGAYELALCHDLAVNRFGTASADTLTGTPGADVIQGFAGDDRIDGGVGNDVVCGGDGNDILLGEAGNDELLGQAGNDRLRGGRGRDRLAGGAGGDRLRGGRGPDRLNGGPGHDRCMGGVGSDVLNRCEVAPAPA